MTHSLGTALVTGASSGIGAVYADRLAKRGYDLILVARNGEKLKSLAARLTSETGRSVKVIPADLGDKAALAKVEAVLRDDKSITMLVNNAGTAALTPLVNSNVDQMEAMITLNVTALTRLTYAVAPAFVARGAGTIINIGSVVGIAPERLKACTAQARPMSSRSPIRCNTSLPTRASVSRPGCPRRPRPTFGKKAASITRNWPQAP
jgi:uncharacterized protein